jgi:hypothetical protein
MGFQLVRTGYLATRTQDCLGPRQQLDDRLYDMYKGGHWPLVFDVYVGLRLHGRLMVALTHVLERFNVKSCLVA